MTLPLISAALAFYRIHLTQPPPQERLGTDRETDGQTDRQTDGYQGIQYTDVLTIDISSTGFLPYTSDAAPTTGEAKNWRTDRQTGTKVYSTLMTLPLISAALAFYRIHLTQPPPQERLGTDGQTDRQTDRYQGIQYTDDLTIDISNTGFLPYTSDAAPTTGEAKNRQTERWTYRQTDRQTDRYQGIQYTDDLTIDISITGFLPYTSDAAPTTGEAKNCRSEKRDPINPEIQKILKYEDKDLGNNKK